MMHTCTSAIRRRTLHHNFTYISVMPFSTATRIATVATPSTKTADILSPSFDINASTTTTTTNTNLIPRYSNIPAHGKTGLLNSLLLPSTIRDKERSHALTLKELVLTQRQLCDVECLLNGAFTPLNGFMDQEDYISVVNTSRLVDGTLFPMPITLDVSEEMAQSLVTNGIQELALKDIEGNIIATLEISSIYRPDKALEAKLVFGGDPEHPAIVYLMNQTGNYYVGGKLKGFQLPPHYDHLDIRQTPQEVRQFFSDNNWENVVAFQTRNPLHRAHFELTERARELINGHLLLHPVVGMTKPGDIDHHVRVKCYRTIMSRYPSGKAHLSALPLAMRMAGPRGNY
jgi:sulfate adenylyltransferase